MAKGLRIALNPFDAYEDTDPNHHSLFVDPDVDYVLIKEKDRQVIDVNGTENIAHGLSYVPFCLVFIEISSGRWRKLFSSPINLSGYWFEVNDTNLILRNTTGVSKQFSYYIFYDNIT